MHSHDEEGVYGDGEPVGPEYIFGDTEQSPDDKAPLTQRPVRSRSFRRVSSRSEHNAAIKSSMKAVRRKRNPLPFATVAVEDPAAPLKDDWSTHTYTEIPDGDGPRRHPLFGINPDIVFDDDYSPEREAESRLPVENLITYEKEDIDRVQEKAKSLTSSIQKRLLEEGAALLISYDDASSFASAVLKDGLGIDVEIDSSVSEAISQMLRLNMISAYMDQMSLPDPIKARFMRVLTEKIAEDTHATIQKKITSEKYSNVLKNLQARMKSSPEQATADIASQLGVVRKRSKRGHGGAGLDQSFGEGIDDQHAFNELQNAGVRFEGV